MSHTRFKLGFVRHKKVRDLSDAAFRLWISAIDHARTELTDGALTESDLDVIARCPPRGPKRKKLTDELVAMGLWERVGDHWQAHDFLDWQDSAKLVRTKLEEARERMRIVRENDKRTKKERSPEVTPTDHHPPSSGSESDSGSPEGVQGEPSEDALLNPPDSDHETVIPLDFERKVLELGVDRILAKRLDVPLESVQARTRNFTGYWGSGAGMGKTKSNWMRAYREDVRQAKERNQLKPPGAIQHSARSGYRGTDDAPNVAASPALALMPGGGR